MNWLEIIELRSVNHDSGTLEKDLMNLMNKMDCEGKPRGIKVYKHATVETDFSVHLYYDTEQTEIRGSKLGLCLVSALKEFGLVNHSIWVERSI